MTSKLAHAIAMLVPIAALSTLFFYWGSHSFSPIDIGVPWLAGKAVLSGLNPYSSKVLQELADAHGLAVSFDVSYFFHPPPMVLFSAMLALWGLSAVTTAMALINSFSSSVLIVLIYWICLREVRHNRSLAALFTVILLFYLLNYLPLHLTFQLSQRSILVALFFIVAVLFFDSHRLAYQFLGGLILSLTLIKPNLFLVSYWVMIVLCLNRGVRLPLVGLATGVCIQLLAVLSLRPEILLDYLSANQAGAATFLTPSLGAWLAKEVGLASILVRLAPIIAFCLAITPVALKLRATISIGTTMAFAVAPSLLLSPYVWSYDFVAYLIPIALTASLLLRGNASSFRFYLVFVLALVLADMVLLNPEGDMFLDIYYSLAVNVIICVGVLGSLYRIGADAAQSTKVDKHNSRQYKA